MIVKVGVLAAIAMALCSCAEENPRIVTYRVDGLVQSARITYVKNGKPVVLEGAVPWETSFDAADHDQLYLAAQNLSHDGGMTLGIYVDGQPVKEQPLDDPFGTLGLDCAAERPSNLVAKR